LLQLSQSVLEAQSGDVSAQDDQAQEKAAILQTAEIIRRLTAALKRCHYFFTPRHRVAGHSPLL